LKIVSEDLFATRSQDEDTTKNVYMHSIKKEVFQRFIKELMKDFFYLLKE